MVSICVIPARRDSKRMSVKMLRTLDGKTLVQRTVAAAIASATFDVVVLSTEDDEIRAQVQDCDAPDLYCHRRLPELTGDTVGAAEIALAVCRHLRSERGLEIDLVACLAPAYPLLTAPSIAEAVAMLRSGDGDCLISVVPTDPHDFHWALRPAGDYAQLYFGKEYLMDRAFLPPILSPTGAIKLARPFQLERDGFFFGERLIPYAMTREESLYVGEELDLTIAEAILRRHDRRIPTLSGHRPVTREHAGLA